MTPLSCAVDYTTRNGWWIVPAPAGVKYPKGIARWPDLRLSAEFISRWWTERQADNVCGLTGHEFDVLDIDPPNGETFLRVFLGLTDNYVHPGPRLSRMARPNPPAPEHE